jgi:hypothetical protein
MKLFAPLLIVAANLFAPGVTASGYRKRSKLRKRSLTIVNQSFN